MQKTIAVFLISAATLLLEISFTRLLSVTHWHHFAFLVISTALLGFGASGVLLSACGERLKKHRNGAPALCAALFAASAPAVFFAGNHLNFNEILFSWEIRPIFSFLLFYLLFAIPFFWSGCALGSIMYLEASQIGSVYAASLYGSAFGCAAIFFLFTPFGGVKIVFLCALGGAASAILFNGKSRSWLTAGALALVIITALLLRLLSPPFELRVSQFKALSYFLSLPDGAILETRWNMISRTDVASSRFIRIPPAGLSLNFKGDIPRQLALTSDADSPSPVTASSGAPGEMAFSRAALAALPYRLQRTGSALIIGAGGGLDVLTARSSGVSLIDAVEINPDVIELLTSRFAAYSGSLFSRPGIRLIQADGRNYLRRVGRRYDAIQIPIMESVAASSAGVRSFSEDYLYTVESFRDCLTRLTPRGILCVARWIKYPPRDSLRLLGLGLTALESGGFPRPHRHLMLIRSWSTTALLMSPGEFTDADILAAKEFCSEMGFDPIYFPGITPADANRNNRLREDLYFIFATGMIDKKSRARFFSDYFFDVSPPTDDRPFFSDFFKVKALPYLWRSMGREWTPFAEWGELVLIALLLQAAVVSALLILMPLMFSGYRHASSPRPSPTAAVRCTGTRELRLLCYFFMIGLAFITVEIIFVQKFVLFLGHPAHAMSIVLSSLLLWAGLGSRWTERGEHRRPLALLCALLAAYACGLSPLLAIVIGLPILARIAVAVALISAPAFLMGTAFPSGIRAAYDLAPALIPWLWAVNGAASVFGAVGAVCVARATGFSVVIALSGALYALASLATAGLQGRGRASRSVRPRL
ncbi:MAG: hypothetical protein NTX71_07320 [Candidatus Aureabacteria bacterium]|nr:hypothetical protein [Candidatus Auribacterota bacterium]